MPVLKNFKPRIKPYKKKGGKVKRQRCKSLNDQTEEKFTITMSIHNFVRQQTEMKGKKGVTPYTRSKIIQHIEHIVDEVSSLCSETSLLIYHRFSEVFSALPDMVLTEEPDFDGIFTILKSSSKGLNYENAKEKVSS